MAIISSGMLAALMVLMVAAARSDASPPDLCPVVAQDVVDAADQLCAGSPAAEALQAVGVLPEDSAKVEETLQQHGFRSVVDLRLLRSGVEEEAELMGHLRTAGVGIADRSKVRLLIRSDAANGRQKPRSSAAAEESLDQGAAGAAAAAAGSRLWLPRQLQQGAGSSDADGLSMDTVIVEPQSPGCCAIRSVRWADE